MNALNYMLRRKRGQRASIWAHHGWYRGFLGADLP